jgi:hypothetical protein
MARFSTALAALLAATAAVVASATTFTVDTDALTYVSGTSVAPSPAPVGSLESATEVVQTAGSRVWHDVSSTPLVVTLKLTHSGAELNAPPANFVRIVGTQRAVGTSVVVSAGVQDILSTPHTISWNITFTAAS